MELVMLIIRAFATLVLSLIPQLKNVSLHVMDSQVVNAMGLIFSLAQVVSEVPVIMEHVLAGQDLQALIAQQSKR
jgi:uncharacterized membrane protein YcgQ (UPF0703/DUF1980 family)